MLQGWVIVARLVRLPRAAVRHRVLRRQARRRRPLASSPTRTSTRSRSRCTARPGPSTAASGARPSSGIGFLPIYLGPTLMVAAVVVRDAEDHPHQQGEPHHLDRRLRRLALRQEPAARRAGDGHRRASASSPTSRCSSRRSPPASRSCCTTRRSSCPARRWRGRSCGDTALYVALMLARFTDPVRHAPPRRDRAARGPGRGDRLRVGGEAARLPRGRRVRDLRHLRRLRRHLPPAPSDCRSLRGAADRAERRPASYATWAFLTLLSMLVDHVPAAPVPDRRGRERRRGPPRARRSGSSRSTCCSSTSSCCRSRSAGSCASPAAAWTPTPSCSRCRWPSSSEALALFAFIGGLSAATGMVIVETIALSTMVCNDLVMPVLLRHAVAAPQRAAGPLGAAPRHPPRRDRRDPAARLRLLPRRRRGLRAGLHRPHLVRRGGAVRAGDPRRHLLEAAAPAPARWPGSRAGFAVWAYTLLLPSFAKSGWLPASFLDRRPLRHRAAAGRSSSSGSPGSTRSRTRCSGACSPTSACYVGVSLRRPAGRRARRARRRCSSTSSAHARASERSRLWRGSASVQDLLPLLGPLPRAGAGARGVPRLRAAARRRARSTTLPRRRRPGPLRRDAARRRHRRRLGARHGRLGGPGGAARARRGDGHPRRGLAGARLQPRARAEVARARGRDRASCAPPTSGCRSSTGMKDDFMSTRHPRAAHAAHLDPRVLRDPARRPGPRRSPSASGSSPSSSRRPSG